MAPLGRRASLELSGAETLTHTIQILTVATGLTGVHSLIRVCAVTSCL